MTNIPRGGVSDWPDENLAAAHRWMKTFQYKPDAPASMCIWRFNKCTHSLARRACIGNFSSADRVFVGPDQKRRIADH